MPPTLFQKLFNKKNGLISPVKASKEDNLFSWATPEFEPSQIRLIVYQDCERRGRNVMFDSNTKRKSEELPVSKLCSDAQVKILGKCCQLKLGGGSSNSLDSSISSSSSSSSDCKEQCPKYQNSRCSSDANMLGEMMFGSVAMSYTGSTLKIHQIRSPPQLMMSKVFTVRTGSSAYGSLNTLQDSLEFISQDNTLKPDHNTSMNNLLGNIVHSNPMDMPGRGLNEDREGGIARSASLSSLLITPFPSPNSSIASSCASSYQRRWLRSQTTSLENGVFPRWSIEESFNMSTDSCGSNPGITRKKKIAIGIIFSLSKDEEQISKFHEFFFSHFPLFESHMNKLKSAIEQAMKMSRRSADANQRTLAYNRIVDALSEFRTTVCNLYTMPRIAEPVWLTMMSGIPEKNQLCQRFMKEFASLLEQSSKNQFLPALLTAVLTNHLAWVPTVMPNGHPPIKIFLEKHSSQSVNMLAKTHPYNPLWAQLGDLYGAIGSPVRLARTVVIGKKQELVQRLLYFLTYFIRCSELQETHLLENGDDEAIVMPGTLITTALEKGEIEDSDYVFVTIHRTKQDLLSEDLKGEHSTERTCKSDAQPHHSNQELTANKQDTKNKVALSKDLLNKSVSKNGSLSVYEHVPPVDSQEDRDILKQYKGASVCLDNKLEKIVPLGSACLAKHLMMESMTEPNAGTKQCDEKTEPRSTSVKVLRSTSIAVEKKPPDKLLSPTFICNMNQLQTKVTFQIGDSMSPDSDTEARSRTMLEQINRHHSMIGVKQNHNKEQISETKQIAEDQSTTCGPMKMLTRVASERQKFDRQFSEGSISLFDDYFPEDEPIECRTIDDILPEAASSLQLELSKRLCPKDTKQQNELKQTFSYISTLNTDLCEKRSAEQDTGENISLHVPSGDNTDSDKKVPSVAEWDIPRNESSDSALGDSESEDTSQDLARHHGGFYYREEQEEWMEETEIPFPGSKLVEVNSVKPSIANFGRSLLGGFCPSYVPDFVLHGTGSDEKLRQCLLSDLSHTVQHPVLDEPIAEAVCIIADVDKWTVQVASSQRRTSDVNKLGKEVLVSSLVSSLLHSTLQLYKHNLSPNFCVMHLEDRLQELYFKSKMLSEYLKGQMRVHVKELSRVLSIESSDLPLLAAIASTHSPYVAQILL